MYSKASTIDKNRPLTFFHLHHQSLKGKEGEEEKEEEEEEVNSSFFSEKLHFFFQIANLQLLDKPKSC